MPIFTVHVPSGVADPKRRAEHTVVLRDGFSWPAFWFGPMALAYRGLWLAGLAWIVLAALIVFVSHALQMSPLATTTLFGLLALLTGMEARGLRQIALERRGYIFAGLLATPNRDLAEQAFFRNDGSRLLPRGTATPMPAGASDVIGGFPRPGGAA